ncbi:hypothetical protein SAMN05444008_105186 [Cnuella takakiae]|uniref:Uncharacterized protein n=1 Tax=Cnuella takakiae TaxID=1302690 RepID=A0A1M4ZEA0_9BACT|nr:DUF5908 family protein [Cnuella takakiae]SHF16137.1 hypothetical protein SAMN05444008_105186 [Cnuella takakiae]
MPVVINEIVITATVDQNGSSGSGAAPGTGNVSVEAVVKEAVEKVLEILDEKKQR